MPKNPAKSKQPYSDNVTNRALVVFTFTFLSVFLLMQAYRVFSQMVFALQLIQALYITAAAATALFIVCLGWFLAVRRNLEKRRQSILTFNGGLFLLVVALSCLIMAYFHLDGVVFLYAALPSAALLYLVYFIYQREFFAVASLCALGALTLWVIYRWFGLHPFRVMLLGLGAGIFFLLCGAVSRLISRGGGCLKLSSKKYRVFPAQSLYFPLYLTCGVLAVCALAAAFAAQLAFYLLLGVCAYLFIMAVYFTVKLM